MNQITRIVLLDEDRELQINEADMYAIEVGRISYEWNDAHAWSGQYVWDDCVLDLVEGEEPFLFRIDDYEDEPVTGTTLPFALMDEDGREVYRCTDSVGIWL